MHACCSFGRCCSAYARETCVFSCSVSAVVKGMQSTLRGRACGCLSTGRAIRPGLPNVRSPRAVQDSDLSSFLAATPRGTILKALLGGLILTAGFASSKNTRPVMAAAGSDIEKVHFLLNPLAGCQAPGCMRDYPVNRCTPDFNVQDSSIMGIASWTWRH